MEENWAESRGFEGKSRGSGSNVKKPRKYERFGETIRYMTWDEWQAFLSSIGQYEHKLMMRTIYELGCRVGEFVRIQLVHVDFQRGRVLFPRQNTKTGRRRVSYLPQGLVNELKSWLKLQRRMGIRSEKVKQPAEYLFSPCRDCRARYSENRIRQIFRGYVKSTGLEREYGRDSLGRRLHELTVHSLRHSHIVHYIHLHKLPIAVVQKQVGHTSLKTTSVYLNPSEEAVAEAYEQAVRNTPVHRHNS
jgi:integrase